MGNAWRSTVKGVVLGTFITLLGGALLVIWIAAHGPGQYFVAKWLWGLCLGSALLAGCCAGWQSNAKGGLVGLVTGAFYALGPTLAVYFLLGWLSYSVQMLLLALVGGFVGGAVGINLKYYAVYQRGSRKRLFSRI